MRFGPSETFDVNTHPRSPDGGALLVAWLFHQAPCLAASDETRITTLYSMLSLFFFLLFVVPNH